MAYTGIRYIGCPIPQIPVIGYSTIGKGVNLGSFTGADHSIRDDYLGWWRAGKGNIPVKCSITTGSQVPDNNFN